MFKYRRVIVGVIAAFLILALLGSVVLGAFAASSSEIKEKIQALKDEAAGISAKQAELKAEIAENKSDMMDLVERKGQIDQEIKLTQDEIDNKSAQIQEYNLLIAEKQNELDDALEEKAQLNEQYRARIRSMEESGKLTYWSILFKASSFADLLDRVDMINEIAAADARMLDKLQAVAQQIEVARAELADEKVALEDAKEELAKTEEALGEQRAEADEVFAELLADKDALNAAAEKYDSMQLQLANQIAQQEVNYQEALDREERERQEAAAAAAAAAAAQNNSGGHGSGNGGGSSNNGGGSGGSGGGGGGGFIWPCSCRTITCYFGPRIHPITGAYSSHSGIDIGCSYGDSIYAAKSGTVTTATFGTAYGNYVTINHGDGFSTLYGHMSQYIVSPGQYVSQGQCIGYVGSTGWSTAPHLHFTVYKNGSLVNPLSYLP